MDHIYRNKSGVKIVETNNAIRKMRCFNSYFYIKHFFNIGARS